MGNSAHALIITTISFPLFFRDYLFKDSLRADSIWSLTTALILMISAFSAPWIVAYAYSTRKRSLALLLTSFLCILPTLLLGIYDASRYVDLILYVISCIGYYISLPLYNSFLPSIAKKQLHDTSSKGWGLGYLGGIIVAVVCYSVGLFEYSAGNQPSLFRLNFLVAGVFLILFCTPMLYSAFKLEKIEKDIPRNKTSISIVWKLTMQHKDILRLFLVYWLIGEVATIGIYFFAIYMRQYAGLEAKNILILSLIIQFIGLISTILSGKLTEKLGAKNMIFIIVLLWACVPILLFGVSLGSTYWFPVVLIGLIVGSYHSIIRAEVAKKTLMMEDLRERGSIWGFFDTTGRFSQILSPVIITLLLEFTSLNYAILFTTLFPLCALLLLKRTRWIGF